MYSMTYRILMEKLTRESGKYYSQEASQTHPVFQIGKFTNVAFSLIREEIKGIEKPKNWSNETMNYFAGWYACEKAILEALGGTDG